MLVSLALLTAWILSVDTPYRVVIDLMVLLLVYGLYTVCLLAMLRKILPYPIGCFSMNSREFTYWKLIAVLTDLAEKTLCPFTTVFTQAVIYSAFGARVGKNTAFAGTIRDLPLISFGDCCTVGQNSVITAHAITGDQITLKPVSIGAGAVVGMNCVVMPGVSIGANAVLAPGAVAIVDTTIPPNELWGGIPARKIKDLAPQAD